MLQRRKAKVSPALVAPEAPSLRRGSWLWRRQCQQQQQRRLAMIRFILVQVGDCTALRHAITLTPSRLVIVGPSLVGFGCGLEQARENTAVQMVRSIR